MTISSIENKTIDQIIEETTNKNQRKTGGELGKNEFLNLLVTQLKYQDPLQPMEDKEFIAQMAQFSSLEQMQNLNGSFQSMKAFSLIGSNVKASVDDESFGTKIIQGLVTSAKMSNGKSYVVVNGIDVDIDRVVETHAENHTKDDNISNYTGLLGFPCKSIVLGKEGNTVIMEGIISTITDTAEGIYAFMDRVKVELTAINSEDYMKNSEEMSEYLERNIGNKISVTVKHPDYDGEVVISAVLRGYMEQGNTIKAVFDELAVPIESIFNVNIHAGDEGIEQDSGVFI